jgi:hypothetical protein
LCLQLPIPDGGSYRATTILGSSAMQFSHHSVDKQSHQANEEKKDIDDNFPMWRIGAQDPKWFSDSLPSFAQTLSVVVG